MNNELYPYLFGEVEFYEDENCYVKHFNYVNFADGSTIYDVYEWSPDFKDTSITTRKITVEPGVYKGENVLFEDDVVLSVKRNCFTPATINKLLAEQCDPDYPIQWVDVAA